jgi:hypothetical protein
MRAPDMKPSDWKIREGQLRLFVRLRRFPSRAQRAGTDPRDIFEPPRRAGFSCSPTPWRIQQRLSRLTLTSCSLQPAGSPESSCRTDARS